MRHARGATKLRVMFGSEIAMGPGKAALLEAIAETGSISASAKRLGMSYRRAWLLVDTMNRCFREPLVASATGGAGGGGPYYGSPMPWSSPVRFAVLVLALALAPAAWAGNVTVFAAASLKEALDAATKAFASASGHKVAISYAGSNALARQIENGAPADLFIAADTDWIAYLEQRNRVAPGSRRNLLANELVLIAPKASTVQLRLVPGANVAQALGGKRIALANPDAVPAGKYAKAAFTALGAWGAIAGKVAATDNVRGALALVARGEAPLGVVYRTDALAEKNVRIVDAFPAGSHPRIVYPIVQLRRAATPSATAMATYLGSPEALAIFARFGFRAP